MKFIDFFAGIGGFRLGLERTGHECVGYVEIDKFARESYEVIHDVKNEWTARDIRKVKPKELPEAEIYTAGFPCQSFSIAGKRGGFEDTRGTLFFEVARLAKERKPEYIILENVKGLLSHDEGKTFGTILNTLAELGYSVEWQVLNSKDFGVPQNRERVFIVGHLRGTSRPKVFPIRRKDTGTLKEHTSGMSQGYRVYDTKGISCTLAGEAGGLGAKTGLYLEGLNTTEENNSYAITTRTHANYDYHGAVEKSQATLVKACLTPDRINKRQNGRRFKENGEPMFTLTGQDKHGIAIKEATKKGYKLAEPGDSVNYQFPDSNTRRGRVGKDQANTLETSDNQGVVTENLRIRKLTPKECWRLQGFPDWAFEKAAEVNSDSQLYRQAGNSVTIPVIEAIGRRLKDVKKKNDG